MSEAKDATEVTRTANRAVLDQLPFEDRRDFEDAARGLIAPLPDDGVIKDPDGKVIWDLSRFSFLHEHDHAPDTVNPSLWRQSQLVVQGGLYKVVDRLYQVRSADLSNLTIVEGDTGLIVFDPLISMLGDGLDPNKARPVRSALEPVMAAADRTGCVVAAIVHFNKAQVQDALTAISGSSAFRELARSIFAFARLASRKSFCAWSRLSRNSLLRICARASSNDFVIARRRPVCLST